MNNITHDYPSSVEAEQSVLAAIINYNTAMTDVREIIADKNIFSVQKHRTIFNACCELFDDGHPVDMITVAEKLKERSELDRVGGRPYLAELVSLIATSANATHHANIVKDNYKRRSVIEVARTLIDACSSGERIDDAIGDGVLNLLSAQGRTRKDVANIPDTLPSVMDRIDRTLKTKDGVIGLRTGFVDLDRSMGGLVGGELITIAGRPGMGKTAFAMSIAENVSKTGDDVLFYSLEMSKEQLAMRLLCSQAGVSMARVRGGVIDQNEVSSLVEATGRLNEMEHLYMDDNSDLTVARLYGRLTRQIAQHNVKLAIVDYLQIMTPPQAQNRVSELSIMTRALKQTATRLNIPIIVLSQLNREVDRRKPPFPILPDLRESGSIEQDSDVVLFVYRPTYYGIEDVRYCPDPQRPGDTKAVDLNENLAEIIIGKNRHGSTPTIGLNFFPKQIKFTNRETKRQEVL